MKRSTQWDLVGVSAALLTFVSFFICVYYRPFEGENSLLLGIGNPLLMIFYLLFSFMSFISAHLESREEELDSNEETEIVFINLSLQ